MLPPKVHRRKWQRPPSTWTFVEKTGPPPLGALASSLLPPPEGALPAVSCASIVLRFSLGPAFEDFEPGATLDPWRLPLSLLSFSALLPLLIFVGSDLLTIAGLRGSSTSGSPGGKKTSGLGKLMFRTSTS